MHFVASQIPAAMLNLTIPMCTYLFQVVAALSVSLVSMIVGYVSAYTSPAAESMKEELSLTDDSVRIPHGFL